MALARGDRVGQYEVVELLGAGGMGEVYRARDTRLNRDVALKVLPDTRHVDAEALARLEREARLLASLNHPNIATLFGIEAVGASQALIMELVDGETLEHRLARSGRLPLADALGVARQIADALDAAHERGVVHRDLKPANVKIRHDGTVKVLDFGIAKALGADEAVPAGATPTVTSEPGAVIGTPCYMSPEQASGRSVDRRTDIWGFGCVLFEMVAGRRAFEAGTVPDTLARVIERDPDWTALPADLPPAVRRVIRLCLEKDVRKRRQAAGDVRIDLDGAREERASGPTPAPSRRALRAAWGVSALAAIAAIVLAVPAVVHLREAPPAEMRLQVVTPPTWEPADFAVSPDGRLVVFSGLSSGDAAEMLFVRALDSGDTRALAETTDARLPFWSPDSRSVAYFASGRLNRIEITGGAPQVLAPAPVPMGGTWAADGTILFAPNTVSPIMRIPATGGAPVAVTALDRPKQMGHRLPSYLPDGRQFLYYVVGEPQVTGVYLGSLDGRAPARLASANTAAVFLAPHYVVFVQQGELVARRLDPTRAELVDDPIVVARGVATDALRRGAFSVSPAGIIAHRSGNPPASRLAWFDRSGGSLEIGEFVANGPELSPDGRRIALDRTVQGNRDVWLVDIARRGLTRFTTDPAVDGYPVWSPTGTEIVFESTRRGTFDLWIKPSSGATPEALLLDAPDTEYPLDWSGNGHFLLYQRTNLNEVWDLLVLPMTGTDRTPIPVATTPFAERMGQFSPDSRWIAYETDESGRPEIVVQAFPAQGERWAVSTAGGVAPRWNATGNEIYFVAPDGKLMAAPIAATATRLEPAAPAELFASQIVSQAFKHQYDVARDGRFLARYTPPGDAPSPPITLILNWRR